jgi:hypothetical protein
MESRKGASVPGPGTEGGRAGSELRDLSFMKRVKGVERVVRSEVNHIDGRTERDTMKAPST